MQDLTLLVNAIFKPFYWFLIGLLVVGLILEFGQLLLIWYEYRMKQRVEAKQQMSVVLSEAKEIKNEEVCYGRQSAKVNGNDQ